MTNGGGRWTLAATWLDDAVLRLRAAAGSGAGPARRGRYLTVLAAAMVVRFHRSADPADLDDAVTFGRAALVDLPSDDPDHATALSTVGAALATRFRLRGTLADLGEAVELAGAGAAGGTLGGGAAGGGAVLPGSAAVAWARPGAAAPPGAVSWPGVFLRGVDLAGRDLRYADLRGADMSGCRLSRADLTGANLAGARLAHARLDSARLNGAVLSGADLTGTWLVGADLTGAELSGAVLHRAVLVGATDRPEREAGVAVREIARILPGPSAEGVAFDSTGDLMLFGDAGQVTLLDTATGVPLRVWGERITFEPEPPSEESPLGSLGYRFPDVFEKLLHPQAGEPAGDPPEDLEDWDDDDQGHEIGTVALSPAGTTAATLVSSLIYDYGTLYHWVTLTVVDLSSTPRVGKLDLDTDCFVARADYRDRRLQLGFSADGRWLVALCEWECLVMAAVPAEWPGGGKEPLWATGDRVWFADLTAQVGEADAWVSTGWDDYAVGGCFALRPGGRHVALACGSHEWPDTSTVRETTAAVRVLDTSTGTVLRHLGAGSGVVRAVSYLADGRLSAVTAGAGFWLLWTWDEEGDDAEPVSVAGDLRAAEYTADGGCVVLVEEGGRTSLRRWDPATGAHAWTTPVDPESAPVLRCSPDGRWIAMAEHLRVTLWSAHDGVLMWTVTGPPGSDPATLTFDPRGRPVTGGGRVVVRDLYTGEPVAVPVADRSGWQILGLTPVRAGSLDRYLDAPTRPAEAKTPARSRGRRRRGRKRRS